MKFIVIFNIVIDIFIAILLVYSCVKFKIESNKNLFFISPHFGFFIIILITTLFFNIIFPDSFFIFGDIIALSCVIRTIKSMSFLSFGLNHLKGLFYKYKYEDIDNISIQNYPDYTNNILVSINLKNTKHKTFKMKYNENLILALNNTNIPILNKFKAVKEF